MGELLENVYNNSVKNVENDREFEIPVCWKMVKKIHIKQNLHEKCYKQ